MPHTWAVMVGLVVVVASMRLAGAQDPPTTAPATVRPVDFRKLQEMLPAEAVGVTRSDLGGDNVTAGEMSMSTARADYTKPDSDGSDARASIEIADYGAVPQMVAGMTAWRTMPVNVENDQGYTRTVKLKDYPAMEVYTKDGDGRQMIVLVAERFLLNIESAHVPEAEFRKFVESLPLEKLATLK
jgi:hypothetical protein